MLLRETPLVRILELYLENRADMDRNERKALLVLMATLVPKLALKADKRVKEVWLNLDKK